jgi:hypothetical protein
MDWVVIGSILTVVVSLVIIVYAGIKLKNLMDSTHSED